VEVRAGTYSILNEGLTVRGLSSGGRAVLTAYDDESVVFDGGSSVRELLRVSGEGTTVERITFQNAGAHNIEVRGGRDHRIQCNRFLRNVSSDSVKAGDGASQVLLRGNDFSQRDSQAIDLTAVAGVIIVENYFHDPLAADGNAIGAKLGSRDVLIARNRFERTGGLAFGGVGEAHDDAFEAFGLSAEENRFEDLRGALVKFYSCSGCSVRRNDVSGASGGFILGGERLEGASGCTGGCRPTESAAVSENRLRRMRGGVESGPNIFWGVFSTETSRLSASSNLYCHTADDDARFLIDDLSIGFAEWVRRAGTDGTSRVAAESESICSGW
jgi:Right handed beta helix region